MFFDGMQAVLSSYMQETVFLIFNWAYTEKSDILYILCMIPMSQCNCHCEVTNLACDTCCLSIKIFLRILSLEIDTKIIKREVVCLSFLFISVFTFFFFFRSTP